MIKSWCFNYPVPGGSEKRRAFVYLPYGYGWERRRRYPVLYAFDGHNLFRDEDATYGKSWGLGEYLDRTRMPLIVAALECSHSPEGGRLEEYCPFDFQDLEDEMDISIHEGRGNDTIEWFIKQFKPMVDSRFRTLSDRDHTFLMGSSFGGVMSLYGVLAYNHVFSRAAVLSPSLWVSDGQLFDLAAQADLTGDTVIYLDYGTEEFWGPNTPDLYYEMVSTLGSRGIALTSRLVPYGDHSEASWQRQLPFAIPTLMYALP